MDLGIIAAVAMLVVWAVGTFVLNDAPGWLHGLLTVGVFVLIWRVVVRGTSGAGRPVSRQNASTSATAASTSSSGSTVERKRAEP
jgi:hypothetical protein